MERLKEIRISRRRVWDAMGAAGISSIRELARRAGMSQTPCYDMYRLQLVSWETLRRIAGALHVDPQELAIDDVSAYRESHIPELCEEGINNLIVGVVKATKAEYKRSYRKILRGKDPDGIERDNMESCYRAMLEWIPEHADEAVKQWRREVESEQRRKAVSWRDTDAPA